MNLGKVSMVHQHGCSVGVLSRRRLSNLAATRGGVLPGIRNLRGYPKRHVPRPKKSQSGEEGAW